MKIRMFCAVALGIVILLGGAPADEAAGPVQAQDDMARVPVSNAPASNALASSAPISDTPVIVAADISPR